MAVGQGGDGVFETILRMKDEASPVLKTFGTTANESFGEASNAARQGADDAERSVSKFRERVGQIAKTAALAAAAAGAAGIAMVRNAINTADAMNQASERTGMSTEALSAWQYKAGLAGVNAGELNKALETMARNLSKAESGLLRR